MSHAVVGVRLDVTDVQAGLLLRAAGARRFANWAVAKIKANTEQWAAEATYGIERAERFFPSSKTCSACGAVRSKLTLAERTYRCDACGLITDRDVNAAANLAAWGEHTLGIYPCVTRAGERHPGGPSAEPVRHACGGWVSAATSQTAAVLPGEAGTSRPRPGVA